MQCRNNKRVIYISPYSKNVGQHFKKTPFTVLAMIHVNIAKKSCVESKLTNGQNAVFRSENSENSYLHQKLFSGVLKKQVFLLLPYIMTVVRTRIQALSE